MVFSRLGRSKDRKIHTFFYTVMTTLDRIHHLLSERGIPFRTIHHEATRTSEASAAVRGEALDVGAKAIVLKMTLLAASEPAPAQAGEVSASGTDRSSRHASGYATRKRINKRFALFVISAARQIDSKKIRAFLGVKKVRFATPDELMELTGLVPGSVPPFGHPILDLDLYVDTSIQANDRVAFNAGSLTDSITMAAEAYLTLAEATLFDFARD